MSDGQSGVRRWGAWRLESAILKNRVKNVLYSLFEDGNLCQQTAVRDLATAGDT